METWLVSVTRFSVMFAALLFLFGPTTARAESVSCPAHAREIKREVFGGSITATCQCLPGYEHKNGVCIPKGTPSATRSGERNPCKSPLILFNGRCEYKAAVEDQLQQRILRIVTSIERTKDAIRAERDELMWARAPAKLEGHLWTLAGLLAAARRSKDPMPAALEALHISSDLGVILSDWGTCSATPDLVTECNNLHNFERMLHDTAKQLIQVEHE